MGLFKTRLFVCDELWKANKIKRLTPKLREPAVLSTLLQCQTILLIDGEPPGVNGLIRNFVLIFFTGHLRSILIKLQKVN